ncbi:MAG: class I SAM-dependent methyltransferase [Xanthobacteraceae bacterium]|nr:class I SAM-dependent methyltransferase [Xanthobacteraceae bacterium]
MNTLDRQAHWQNVYQTKGERDVSWFQETPEISLDLIRATGAGKGVSIVDIGGGASRLADALLEEGYRSITVLDLSDQALATSRARLGARAAQVSWIVADVTAWQPAGSFDVWHDRAAFHFLTEPQDRLTYGECVRKAVRPGGHVIIGTFALDGPERCSGLPVVRHDATTIGNVLGRSFRLAESRRHEHKTPGGAIQRFQFSRFRRDG